jgi:hypothetical protein
LNTICGQPSPTATVVSLARQCTRPPPRLRLTHAGPGRHCTGAGPRRAGRAAPGVNGALEATGSFAASWLAVTGHASAQVTATRLYRLGTLRPPEGVAGHGVIAATAQDVDLVGAWLAAFHARRRATVRP